ncbi:hypothetical protein BDR04DRAFT_1179764 [Suillus decipiens]|nr:hypothetical protein BDR04DRAFT_1179764 [Suillus decipiens]
MILIILCHTREGATNVIDCYRFASAEAGASFHTNPCVPATTAENQVVFNNALAAACFPSIELTSCGGRQCQLLGSRSHTRLSQER